MTLIIALVASALAGDGIKALAPDSVSGTPTKGTTAEVIAAATTRVSVASFTHQKVTWDVKCKGPATALSCTVTTNAAGKTGSVQGGAGSTLHLQLGDRAVDLGVTNSPVPFDGLVIDNGSGR